MGHLRGPCLAPIAACATGLIAALRGASLIRRGACDLALVGAGDASLDPLMLGAFRRMGILARTGDGLGGLGVGDAPERTGGADGADSGDPADRDRGGHD